MGKKIKSSECKRRKAEEGGLGKKIKSLECKRRKDEEVLGEER